MKFKRDMNLNSLLRPKFRQSWNKQNLYNLSNTSGRPQRPTRTFFQQKWTAKAATRGYHGEHVREKKWERMFSRRLDAVVEMDPHYMARHDGSEQAAGRGSGTDRNSAARRTISDLPTPYMAMTFAPLERRLDVAIFRALFASSTREARMFVVHGGVKVNGKKMVHAGYLLNPGDLFQVDVDRVLKATGFRGFNDRFVGKLSSAVHKGALPAAKREELREEKARTKRSDESIAARQEDFRRASAKSASSQSQAATTSENPADTKDNTSSSAESPITRSESESTLSDTAGSGGTVEQGTGPSQTSGSGAASGETSQASEVSKGDEATKADKASGAEEPSETGRTSNEEPITDKHMLLLAEVLRRTRRIGQSQRALRLNSAIVARVKAIQGFARYAFMRDYLPNAGEALMTALTEEIKGIEERVGAEIVAEKGLSSTPELPTDVSQLQQVQVIARHNLSQQEENLAEKPTSDMDWAPKNYMSPFAFIPRYLEVNPRICAAVYLRHPVARQGFGEVPTPFSYTTSQLAFGWYLRRR